NTDPVYAFEYTVQPGETPRDISAPITRGCRLGLTDGIVEHGDDFTELRRLKPEYYTRDQTLMARGPPRICEHSFEYAKIENDVRVVDRDIYTGRYDRLEKYRMDGFKKILMGSRYHYFSQIPHLEIVIRWGEQFDIYDDDGKHGPFPVKWIPAKGFGTYKFAIDKKRYAVFIHYYMLVINVETKETTVLRVNGVSQHPKRRMYFDNIMAG
ncbi:hypothetical protein FOZ63_012944, partial [Perkinsus olseni]